MNLELGDGVTDFADVDSKSALAVYVDAIAEAGITIGKTDGTFGFGDKLKRADFSAMVYRAENLEEAVSGVSVVEATYDDDTKDQFVAIKLDGKRVTAQELITDGYTVEFEAYTDKNATDEAPIFADGETSTTGKLALDLEDALG